MQWPVGSFSDHFNRQRVLALLLLLIGLSSGGLILATGQRVTAWLSAAALYGGFVFTLYPISVAHTNDRIENSEIVATCTALIFFYGLGACIGPIAAACCMDLVGPKGLFFLICGLSLVIAIVVFTHGVVEKPKRETAVPYVPVPRTSSVITTLHPHAENEKTFSS